MRGIWAYAQDVGLVVLLVWLIGGSDGSCELRHVK